MDEEELREFLKKNLQIRLEHKKTPPDYYGSYKILAVSLFIGDECISSDMVYPDSAVDEEY